MAERNFSTMERHLAPNVPGCPLPTIIDYVREAAIEVCERTQVYKYKLDDISTVDGTHTYTPTLPSGTALCGVHNVTVDNTKTTFLDFDTFIRRSPKWPDVSTSAKGQPTSLSTLDYNDIVVNPVPDAVYTIEIIAALKPTKAATSMEETVFDLAERAILNGALQRLLVMPNKSWTDRQAAAYHAKQFVFKVASLRADVNLSLGRRSLVATAGDYRW